MMFPEAGHLILQYNSLLKKMQFTENNPFCFKGRK